MSALAFLLAVPMREPDFSLIVPGGTWLNANDGKAWYHNAGPVRAWRDAGAWTARAMKVPHMRRAYVLAEIQFPDLRRNDPANWYPTVKPVIDGLVDARVLPDDSGKHLLGPDIRLGRPLSGITSKRLTVHLWRLE